MHTLFFVLSHVVWPKPMVGQSVICYLKGEMFFLSFQLSELDSK